MTNKSTILHRAVILLACAVVPSRAHAEPATVEMANKAQISAATELYEQGVVAFDAGKNEQALQFFTRSNDIVTSPNSRMMLGLTLAKLGRFPEAYQELSESIRLTKGQSVPQKRYKKTAETAQHELTEVANQLAFVRVNSAAKVRIQERDLPDLRSQDPIAVTPGVVSVEVTFRNGTRVSQQLNLKPGEHAEVNLEPPEQRVLPPSTSASTSLQTGEPSERRQHSGVDRRTLGYVIGTFGVLGIGTFVGFGVVGAGHLDNAKADCIQQICPESSVDKQGTHSLYQGIGYTGLAIGVVGIGVGTWLVLGSSSSAGSSTSLQVGPLGAKLIARF